MMMIDDDDDDDDDGDGDGYDGDDDDGEWMGGWMDEDCEILFTNFILFISQITNMCGRRSQ